MKLFHVQDDDRPMYVVASDWGDAVRRWERQIIRENEMDPGDEVEPPDGVHLLAENSREYPELLLPEPSDA